MCRKRGRIVLVGVVGLELNRTDFYEKEISFQVSCSYGPGRYDPDYEEKDKIIQLVMFGGQSKEILKQFCICSLLVLLM